MDIGGLWRKVAIGLLSGLVILPLARADEEISKDWQEYQANTKAYVTGHASKLDGEGHSLDSKQDSFFSASDISSEEFIKIKADSRKELMKAHGLDIDASPLLEEKPDLRGKVLGFLDTKEFASKGITPVFRLEEFDSIGLHRGVVQETPWGGSYWPTFQGLLGARYGLRTFMGLKRWSQYHSFVLRYPLGAVVATGDPREIDFLSPSEKYDLLIGQPRGSSDMGALTTQMWADGQWYLNKYGRVEEWMGICHGWAPASFMNARPMFAVHAHGVGGRLKFYPADTKGLLSLLWAKGTSNINFYGGRCESRHPRMDPTTGRLLDNKCFEVNPGVWHTSVVNQVGLDQRSFVIDVGRDHEIWNQPVKAYKYRYFNPQTGQMSSSYGDAVVSRQDFRKDKFRRFRSRRAAAFVGVQMDLTYVKESPAYQEDVDNVSRDALRTIRYLYDLELDDNGNIIGGEWYRNEHPDFEWLPHADTQPLTSGDRGLTGASWDPARQPVPGFWRDIAIRTARVNGEPLAAIVEPLAAAAARGGRLEEEPHPVPSDR